MPIERAQIVALARRWIGTPFVHQASLKGAGCDCLGLVRGVWRELFGAEPEPMPSYRADWAELTGEELLYQGMARHCLAREAQSLRRGAALAPGSIVLIRLKPNGRAKHSAIAAAGDRIVHAYSGGAVTESALPPAWRRRIAFAFDFPGVTD